MTEDGYPVKLHVYDLSQGMARQLPATIVGREAIEAIWHTGVVVYGREYYFGGGIQEGQPGRTPYGTPVRVEDLGVTHVPREVFEEFLREIGPRYYTLATYKLLNHNCNSFSNEAAQFLAGSAIPSYILELPNQVMNSPVGALILPMIQGLEASLGAGAVPQPPQFRPVLAPLGAATVALPLTDDVEPGSAAADEPEAAKIAGASDGTTVPLSVQPAAAPAAAAAQASAVPTVSSMLVPPDPHAEAKSRVQEEIKREFADIMAAGTARAGEAAALATRRVMERHGAGSKEQSLTID